MTVFDLIPHAQLMLTAVIVGTFGAMAISFARRTRTKPRNVRRVPLESGNTIERRPNVRRPSRDAEIRALVSAPPMSSTPTVIVPAWDDAAWDEPTMTGPRGEA